MSRTLQDKLYGSVEVHEALLVELLESAPLERLKGVTMGGITAVLGISPSTSRYEHSVGAMLLVRSLGGSVYEQAAALLHDISHTALSHVIDFVFGAPGEQSFHDEWQAHYVETTELPQIAARHGVCISDLLDEKRHTLLEQPIPRLCADRVDYTLRDLEPLGVASSDDAKALFADLTTHNGRMAFRSRDSAHRFAGAYLECAQRSWSNPRQVALYELCGHALRYAFDKDVLTEDDIWGTDRRIWSKVLLAADGDKELRSLTDKVSAETKVWLNARESASHIRLQTKARWIDPEVAVDGQLRPLSSISTDYADKVAIFRQEAQKPKYAVIE